MPLKRYPSERGDLYVRYQVFLPQTLTIEQQQGIFEVNSSIGLKSLFVPNDQRTHSEL
jgi:DnaJ-class molecular chaperone